MHIGSNASTLVAAVLGLVVSVPAHAGDVYRCVDGGRVLYTDRACGQEGAVIAVGDVVAVGSASAAEFPNGYARATPVTLGMSPSMVQQAMGRPAETIATLEGRTLVEYWLYRSGEGTTRIAFQDGRVTRISTR